MKLPPEIIEKLEQAMNNIAYGTAEIQWVEKGTFIELRITEKTRFEKPETYHRG